ncbi:D-2-hydroxyacid dehydrogenase [Caenimonas sedimenti]|nr:D-2-hydroxyacid dehydrogenase [Caenimonas sedimenti]
MPTCPTILLWTPFTGQQRMLAEGLRNAACELVAVASEAEAIAALASADGALFAGVAQGYSPALAQAVLQAPRLRWLQLISTGQEAVEQHGLPPRVAVTSVGDTAAGVVAEHAVALLLALGRRLGDAAVQGARAEWNRAYAARMDSLDGRTLCLVGYGRIGKETARRVQGFGMRCIAVNRSGVGDVVGSVQQVLPLARLHEALAQSDAVSLSLPGTAETHRLFGAAEWAACKRGALVVNVGRGTVVDTASLVAALHSGHLAGAGLDVTDPEPLPADHALWKAPGVLITPHVGGAGNPQGVARLAALIVENVRRFGAGEELLHPVQIQPSGDAA